MVPIGIVTRDRAAYLDVTLRSLSATDLPRNISLTVFDDCSTDARTRAYYATDQQIEVDIAWPGSDAWRRFGLNIVSDDYQLPKGIAGRVDVVRLGDQSQGVINASCAAARSLFQQHKDAQGVLLLQDDVIFNADWYTRMLDTVTCAAEYAERPLGLLAGLKLNQQMAFVGSPPRAVSCGITAQCMYIPRATFDSCRWYFVKRHSGMKRFDDTLRREVVKKGKWAGCIYPFVCQHIGINSIVRPGKKWTFAASGRIGYYAYPPYALAADVAQFRSRP